MWSNRHFVSYTNWGAGEPNNDDGKDCGVFQEDGTWALKNCEDRYPAICKIPQGKHKLIAALSFILNIIKC